MIRNLIRFVLVVLAIALVRYIFAAVSKAVSQAVNPQPDASASRAPRPAGELKKDPVCETFVLASASIKKTVNGEEVHFCSAACRDKYQVA